jgi:arylsulfatase
VDALLFRDHTQIYPWIGKADYNLTTDMADEAIKYLKSVNASAPNQPFFLYYAPGGTHSPHQPTRSGLTSSRASSTWVGMSCASKFSPTRSG